MTKDDKYGWLVVGATFFVGFITDGLVFSFGILLIEFLHTFNQGRASTVIIGSIINGVMHLIGPVAGLLSDRYGCRIVVIAGSLISSLGFLISAFVDKMSYLYVTYGLLGGLGFGLMYLPASVCVIQHFDKQRSLATGIAMCGSGAGSFTFNLITGYLLDMYGWRGTILIQAGFLLNGIVCGLILVSPETQENDSFAKEKNTNTEKSADIDTDGHNSSNGICDTSRQRLEVNNITSFNQKEHHPKFSNTDGLTINIKNDDSIKGSNISLNREYAVEAKDKTEAINKENCVVISYSEGEETAPRDTYHVLFNPDAEQEVMLKGTDHNHELPVDQNTEKNKIVHDGNKSRSMCKDLCDISLLKNGKLVAFLLSGLFVNLAFTVPFTFLPDQAVEQGMDKYQAYWLASSIGITNTISRIIVGWIADHKLINRLVLLGCFLLFVGIFTILSVLLFSFPAKLVYSCVFGFLIGGYVATSPVVLADLFGVDVIARSFGLLMFAIGISGIVSSPIAGWLYDQTGSYTISFVTAGCEFILGACVLFFVEYLRRRNSK